MATPFLFDRTADLLRQLNGASFDLEPLLRDLANLQASNGEAFGVEGSSFTTNTSVAVASTSRSDGKQDAATAAATGAAARHGSTAHHPMSAAGGGMGATEAELRRRYSPEVLARGARILQYASQLQLPYDALGAVEFTPGGLVDALDELVDALEVALLERRRNDDTTAELCDDFLHGTCPKGVACERSHSRGSVTLWVGRWLSKRWRQAAMVANKALVTVEPPSGAKRMATTFGQRAEPGPTFAASGDEEHRLHLALRHPFTDGVGITIDHDMGPEALAVLLDTVSARSNEAFGDEVFHLQSGDRLAAVPPSLLGWAAARLGPAVGPTDDGTRRRQRLPFFSLALPILVQRGQPLTQTNISVAVTAAVSGSHTSTVHSLFIRQRIDRTRAEVLTTMLKRHVLPQLAVLDLSKCSLRSGAGARIVRKLAHALQTPPDGRVPIEKFTRREPVTDEVKRRQHRRRLATNHLPPDALEVLNLGFNGLGSDGAAATVRELYGAAGEAVVEEARVLQTTAALSEDDVDNAADAAPGVLALRSSGKINSDDEASPARGGANLGHTTTLAATAVVMQDATSRLAEFVAASVDSSRVRALNLDDNDIGPGRTATLGAAAFGGSDPFAGGIIEGGYGAGVLECIQAAAASSGHAFNDGVGLTAAGGGSSMGGGVAAGSPLNHTQQRATRLQFAEFCDAVSLSVLHLERLSLAGNPLGYDGCRRLLDRIDRSPLLNIRPAVLSHLDLSCCGLGDAGAIVVADYLKGTYAAAVQRELGLQWQAQWEKARRGEQPNAGAASSSDQPTAPTFIYGAGHTLRSLNLSWNNISADGAVALADALTHPRSQLRTLNLSCNPQIGRRGAAAIASALKRQHEQQQQFLVTVAHQQHQAATGAVGSKPAQSTTDGGVNASAGGGLHSQRTGSFAPAADAGGSAPGSGSGSQPHATSCCAGLQLLDMRWTAMGDEGGMAFLDAVTYIYAAVAASAGTNAAVAKAGAHQQHAAGALGSPASPMLSATTLNATSTFSGAGGGGGAAAATSVLSVGFSIVEINLRECGVDPRLVQLIAEKLARGAELAELIKSKNDFPPNTASTTVAASTGTGGERGAVSGSSAALSGGGGASASKGGTAMRAAAAASRASSSNGGSRVGLASPGLGTSAPVAARGGGSGGAGATAASTAGGGGAGGGGAAKFGSIAALGDEHLVDLALRVARDRTDVVAALTLEGIW